MSILGNAVLRVEDPKLLSKGGTYVADLLFEDPLYVGYVTSTIAHARIVNLEVEAARSLPGVVAVFANGDIDLAPPPPPRMFNVKMARQWLADSVVRYVGEPVVLIVAESAALVEDAMELVYIEYEPLGAVIDPLRALEGDTLLFPEAGTNIAFTIAADFSEDFFSDADVVIKGELINQRLAPAPLEVRSAAARWDSNGSCEFFVSSQVPHAHRDAVADAMGVERSRVRVVTPDVGGGFGAKASIYNEEILVAYAARRLGRAVKWVESRSQSMVGLGHGRGQIQRIELGARRDGILTGYRIEVIQDSGAYPMLGAFLPQLTRMMATGVYAIPKCEFRSMSVVTNTTPIVAYRGAGRPEATAAIERAVDMMADALGIDAAEIRRRNFITPQSSPYTSATGTTYDESDYPGALATLLEAADYDALIAEQRARRERGDHLVLGIGLSTYVEVTNGFPSSEYARVEVLETGKARVFSGSVPQGQGHDTSWAMLVSDSLGIAIGDIEVIHGDTARIPRGVGTFGSRSLQVGGVAVHQASVELAEIAAKIVAEALEANPADIVIDPLVGAAHVIGSPTPQLEWSAIHALAKAKGVQLMVESDFAPEGPTYPFGAHLGVVEVDLETGKSSLVRMAAVDDAGTILNPLLAAGQVHGGIAQGIAQALFEEVAYDEAGNPLTSNFADYGVVSADLLPSFELFHNSTPTSRNPLGAKGIGESGTIGAGPAVWNAVVDALSYLGVRHIAMPASPYRVYEAMRAQGRSI